MSLKSPFLILMASFMPSKISVPMTVVNLHPASVMVIRSSVLVMVPVSVQTSIHTAIKTFPNVIWLHRTSSNDPTAAQIPVNIVDLGLVYDCHVVDTDEGGNHVDIVMTLTAPGCGMGPFIVEDVRQKILSVANVSDVHVDLVFEPPWDRSMMSDEAKLHLGMF